MKRILLIILIFLAATTYGFQTAYYKTGFSVGDIAFTADSTHAIAVCAGDSVAFERDISGFVTDSLYDSISGAFGDCVNLFVTLKVWKATVGWNPKIFYPPIQAIQTFVNIGAGGNPDLCTVYHIVRNTKGENIEGAYMRATLLDCRNVEDTCANTAIGGCITNSAPSDTSGIVSMELNKTKCLDGSSDFTGRYSITIYLPSEKSFYKWSDTIPDVDSLLLER